ncbi:hypothetical protein HF086_003053 [Spodoptera exigua]|uniref:WH1 domain-containing protein n=1 Tax=Spodoptera exigua TaxID=7107 RepID=A0A922M1F8_SPOEX|nr:hypothetical protein HF086_003053 [Spodoptera exigua]
MTFTKTSQKFGQWSDVRANTVYGLGFASEPELGKPKPEPEDMNVHQRAHSVSSTLQWALFRMESGYATVGRAPRGPLATAGPPAVIDPPPPESIEQQLRYENDRLKLALAQR